MDNKVRRLEKSNTEMIDFGNKLFHKSDSILENIKSNDIRVILNTEFKNSFYLNVFDRINIKENVISMKFHTKENIIALGLINGQIILYNLDKLKIDLIIQSSQLSQPITRLFWSKTFDNHLFSSSTDGNINFFNSNTGKVKYNYSVKQKQILCFDLGNEESTLTFGDELGNIEVIDLETLKQKKVYIPHTYEKIRHNNRISTIKYVNDENPYLFISGSIDGNLIFWDERKSKAIDKIFGPKITGDGLDINGNNILVSNYGGSEGEKIQIFDLRKKEKLDLFQNNTDFINEQKLKKNNYNFCKFMNKNTIIGGGSQPTFLNLFNINSDNKFGINYTLKGLYKGVIAGDCNRKKNLIAFVTGDNLLNILNLNI